MQYSTGYRTGYGNDSRSVSLGVPSDVDAEYLTNYEVGYKSRLLNNRLNVSAAVFYMDYDDLQVPLPSIATTRSTRSASRSATTSTPAPRTRKGSNWKHRRW